MANALFNEQDTYPIVDAVTTDTWPGNYAPDCFTNFLQITPVVSGISCPSWIPPRNALGLYGPTGPDTDRTLESYAQFLSTPFSHQPSHSDSASPFDWHSPSYSSLYSEAPLARVVEAHIPPSFHTTLPERRAAPNANHPVPDKQVNASPARSVPSRQVRHTPYPTSTRRCSAPASVYQCRWSNGVTPCGALVTGTKNAIGKHLQKAHAIRLKADKTQQACLWGRCRKSMRRESIPRHVLAVHMQDKVLCPTCGSQFARTDSLQRHQKAQCLVEREASDAVDPGE